MSNFVSLLVSAVTLIVVIRILVAVFGPASPPTADAAQSPDGAEDDSALAPSGQWDHRKMLGRWDTPGERDRYLSARGLNE